jgi:hypothetical protein
MLRLVSHENFNGDIVRGLFRRHSELDFVRVQDAGLMQTPDADIPEWAASQGRVLLSHDVSTVPQAVYQCVADGDRLDAAENGGRGIRLHESDRKRGQRAFRRRPC